MLIKEVILMIKKTDFQMIIQILLILVLGGIAIFFVYSDVNHKFQLYNAQLEINQLQSDINECKSERIEGLNIVYRDLSDEQIAKTEFLLNQIKAMYLVKQKQIIFIKNINDYCDSCAGQNTDNGRLIYVEYLENDLVFKKVICHELLHSYIISNDDLEEQIVDDLDEQEVCYE
jgi:hypothetical protein